MEPPPSRWQQHDLLTLLAEQETPPRREPEAPLPSPGSPPGHGVPQEQQDPATGQLADQRPQPPNPPAAATTDPGPMATQDRPAAPPRCPATLLILDTETTGLDPSQGQCIEVGAILFAVSSRAVLSQLSFLLPCQRNPAQAINGIAAAVTRLPQPLEPALQLLAALLASADAVVAHNAAFDRQWFGIAPLPAIERPWICSMEDIRWPAERQLRPNPSVRDLALAYEVPVWAAHRALTDCTYLAQVFQRCADLESLLVGALEPRQLFRATVSYADRHRAKEAGFRWNDPVSGAWTRRLSEREARALPFPVQPVSA